jgi:hypothetical protein
MAILSNNAKVTDSVDVLRVVKAKNGTISRDLLVMVVFGSTPADPDYKEYCKRVENVARASKDQSDNSLDLYLEVYGQVGTLQSIIIEGTSYYRHIPLIEGVDRKSYNPNKLEDVTDLIPLVLKLMKTAGENNSLSISDVAYILAVNHGYTMGSVAPTIGTILAQIKLDASFVNDKDRLAKEVNGLVSRKKKS